MIHIGSVLGVADNSGAKKVQCIGMLGRSSTRGYVSVGDIITVSVKSTIPNSKIKKGSVTKAVIVRTIYNIQRSDGGIVSFGDNAAVLIEKNDPIGTRVFGAVAREVRSVSHKVASLSDEVI